MGLHKKHIILLILLVVVPFTCVETSFANEKIDLEHELYGLNNYSKNSEVRENPVLIGGALKIIGGFLAQYLAAKAVDRFFWDKFISEKKASTALFSLRNERNSVYDNLDGRERRIVLDLLAATEQYLLDFQDLETRFGRFASLTTRQIRDIENKLNQLVEDYALLQDKYLRLESRVSNIEVELEMIDQRLSTLEDVTRKNRADIGNLDDQVIINTGKLNSKIALAPILSFSYRQKSFTDNFYSKNLSFLPENGSSNQLIQSANVSGGIIINRVFILSANLSYLPSQVNVLTTTDEQLRNGSFEVHNQLETSGYSYDFSGIVHANVTNEYFFSLRMGYAVSHLKLNHLLSHNQRFIRSSDNDNIVTPMGTRDITTKNPFAGLNIGYSYEGFWVYAGYNLEVFDFKMISSHGPEIGISISPFSYYKK